MQLVGSSLQHMGSLLPHMRSSLHHAWSSLHHTGSSLLQAGSHLHYARSSLCLDNCFLVVHVGFVVVSIGLSCPTSCRILAPWPGMKHTSHALEGKFLTTRPPGKSLYLVYSSLYLLKHIPLICSSPPSSPFGNCKFVFHVCETVSALHIHLFRIHIRDITVLLFSDLFP